MVMALKNEAIYVCLCTLLFAFVLLSSGCSENVSGLYRTDEMKKTIQGSNKWIESVYWSLDLSESGNFLLEERREKKLIQDEKYSPIPLGTKKCSGRFTQKGKTLSLFWETSIPLEVKNQNAADRNALLLLRIQQNSDLVVEDVMFLDHSTTEIDLRILDIHFSEIFGLKHMRFTKYR